MFTRHDGFLMMLLPKIEGRWAPVIAALRRCGASPRGDLQALVEAGATPGEIADLATGYFHAATAVFGGLGSGFTPRQPYRKDSLRMALWLMDCLVDPWPVLDELGVDRGALVRYLFSACNDWEWARKADLVGIPDAFRPLIEPGGITWQGPAPFPPLPWFPNPLGAGLHLTDLEGPLPVPDDFRWAGTIHLRGCRNLGDVRLSGGGKIQIEDCPGLLSLQVKGEVEQVMITGCPDLKSIRLGMVGLPVPWGSRRPFIRFDLDVLAFGVPGPKVRESHHHKESGVWLTDYPGLTQLRMGAGDLGLQACHGLEVLHRPSVGNIQVMDCAGLAELRMGPGDLAVARCPGLTLIRREGTGEARVADCTALTVIDSQFSKHMDPGAAIRLKACPSLTELRSQSQDLRHCGDIHLEDCASLRQLPYLRVQGTRTIQGCPQMEQANLDQRRGGWIIGTRTTSKPDDETPLGPKSVDPFPCVNSPHEPVIQTRSRALEPAEHEAAETVGARIAGLLGGTIDPEAERRQAQEAKAAKARA